MEVARVEGMNQSEAVRKLLEVGLRTKGIDVKENREWPVCYQHTIPAQADLQTPATGAGTRYVFSNDCI